MVARRVKGDSMKDHPDLFPERIRGRFPAIIREKYEIYEWRHASTVLMIDFSEQWEDLLFVLERFSLKRSDLLKRGGNKSLIAKGINGLFAGRGWKEKHFDVAVTVDNRRYSSPTHGVDYFKNGIAVETEWNNKDPFYDRDLNNFRLLHELRVISVGVIITRGDELQELFDDLGRGDSYGDSTTHIGKLIPRAEGRGAGGCPVLAFGITKTIYDPTQ